MSKQAGRMSQGANDFLQPCTPTITGVTNVGTNRGYNDGAVDIAFSATCTYPATSYTVLSSGGQTATGSSSPIRVTGLLSGTSYTFQVKGINAEGESQYSAASSPVTATTVPAQPGQPSVSTVAIGGSAAQGSANTATDTVSWSAPNNGGSSITNYYWASSDGKSGNTTSTSVAVSQESGTAQTYTVRADNANGSSATSPASGSVTSAFSFTPFSVFSFSPFGVFSFSPFGVFSFSPFGFSPFGFSPFGFSPFGFSPFSVFGFSPFSFGPSGGFSFVPAFMISLAPYTKVRMADGTMKEAQDLYVGDTLMSVQLPGMSDVYSSEQLINWTPSEEITDLPVVTTTINRIYTYPCDSIININQDTYSPNHILLIKRGEDVSMKKADQIVSTDLVWNYDENGWVPITALETVEYHHNVISVNCEPYDIFFTEGALTHDGAEFYLAAE